MLPTSAQVIGVTGATGTLGSRLTPRLIAKGYEVVCLVRSKKRFDSLYDTRVACVEGDITDRAAVRKFAAQCDVIIHLASKVDHGLPAEYRTVNVDGTENLCSAILTEAPHCRLIHCSTISVLRRHRFAPWLDTMYARSKAMADDIVERSIVSGLNGTIIYPGIIYGPGDRVVLPSLARYLERRSVPLLPGGEVNAPLIYIDDLCRLFEVCVEDTGTVGGHYIGVGPQTIGIHDLIRLVAEALRLPPPKRRLPRWPLLLTSSILEGTFSALRLRRQPPLSRRIVNFLSLTMDPKLVDSHRPDLWRPIISPEEGLAEALKWCQEAGVLSGKVAT